MQLNIPNEYESLIKARALAAGFDERLGEYLVQLVTQDVGTEQPAFSAIDLENSSPEEISRLIDDGYASGIAGEMNEAYFDRLRADLKQ